MTEEEAHRIHIAYQWLGLVTKNLQPFLTQAEWIALVKWSRPVVSRLMKETGLELDPREWPETESERWEACK